VLYVHGLHKSYRGRTAVDRVDLSIAPGERVALIGPNGAGKTTTLMSCLGMIEPDAGTVELLGSRTRRARRAALARVGYTAGQLPLPPHLRVAEYLALFGRLYGAADPGEQALAGLRRFGIEHLARRMGAELSSGQRTLVGIVKATMHAPALLVLDEPTSSLDPEVARRARRGLLELCGAGDAALLITSHNMAEVEQLAQRAIFLLGGRVVLDGGIDEIAVQFGHRTLEDTYLYLSDSQPQSAPSRGA